MMVKRALPAHTELVTHEEEEMVAPIFHLKVSCVCGSLNERMMRLRCKLPLCLAYDMYNFNKKAMISSPAFSYHLRLLLCMYVCMGRKGT